jgi:hypothetical protein
MAIVVPLDLENEDSRGRMHLPRGAGHEFTHFITLDG